jgi:hypothetical protein
LSEKDVDRKLPCRDEYFNSNKAVETLWFHASGTTATPRPDKYLGPFSYYIEVIGILSRIHLFLRTRIDISVLEDVSQWQRDYRALDRELQSWRYSLPAEYRNISKMLDSPAHAGQVDVGVLLLHATYFT